jgi:hypothetical protein
MNKEIIAPFSNIQPREADGNPGLTSVVNPTGLVGTPNLAFPAVRYTEGMALPEFSRLVVLVPDRDVDETLLARKIWSLLPRRKVEVLFVSLVTDSTYGPEAQRRLVTLAAVTQDIFYRITTRLIFGRNWIKGLEGLLKPGDLVVCHTCQQTHTLFQPDVALSELIVSQLKTSVLVISGIFEEVVSPHSSRWLRQIVFWGILVGILAGFFVFEVDIDRLATGWISSVLFFLVFAVEVLLIWMWNFLRV